MTFTARVAAKAPSTAVVTAGTVQFSIDGVNLGAPVSVDSNGVAVSIPAGSSVLSAGTHAIIATYSGASNFKTSVSSSAQPSVLSDGPIAYYPLNETAGLTAYDDAGSSNGNYFGGIAHGVPGPIPGTTGVQLSGIPVVYSEGSVGLDPNLGPYPNVGSTTNYVLTFETWFKAPVGSTGGVILGAGGGGVDVPAVLLGQDGKVRTTLFYGGDANVITSPSSYADGRWHLLDTSYDHGTQTLYIDNVLLGTRSFSETAFPFLTYYLGTCDTSGNNILSGPWAGSNGARFDYQGDLAQAAFYPTALTPAQIAAHYAMTSLLIQTVSEVDTAATVVSSLNPSVVGQPITLTATVSSGSGLGTPTGTVTFVDETYNQTLGTATLSGGVASITTSSVVASNTGFGHAIGVSYSGDSDFEPISLSQFGNLITVQTQYRDDTSTTVVSSASSATFGQPVTFTANVSVVAPGAAVPNWANIDFFVDGVDIGTVACQAGAGSITTNSLTVGDHIITARFSGDEAIDNGSTSAPVTQTINPGVVPCTTALVTSDDSTVFGQPVTLTATVSGPAGQGTPSGGIVTFSDESTVLGTVTLSGGTASMTIASLPVGSHTISASYNGDGTFNRSTSAGTGQGVNQGNTTTTLASTAVNPSVVLQSVEFTATVAASAPAAGTPSGTVTFFDAGVPIGLVTLSGGVATLAISTLAAGTHSITATYNGDGNFTGSSSAAIDQTVNPIYSSPATAFQLIEDIISANSASTTITLPANAIFAFTSADNSTDGANAMPVITGNVTIIGSGDTLERTAGAPAFRLFDVASGGSLTLENLILSGGLAKGAGIAAYGGAICSSGALTLDGVTIESNAAQGSTGSSPFVGGGGNGANASGGGLYVAGGAAMLTDDILETNSALAGNGGRGGSLTIRGGDGGNGGAADGGALCVAGGNVTLSSVTLVDNAAVGGNGGGGGNGQRTLFSSIDTGGNGGNGGNAMGGGLYVSIGVNVLGDSATAISDNSVTAGTAGFAGSGIIHGHSGAAGSTTFANIAANNSGLGNYVTLTTPTLTATIADSSGAAPSGAMGEAVYDAATVVGTAGAPTGSVTYYFYNTATPVYGTTTPVSMQTVTLSGGNVPHSATTAALSTGYYAYIAAYSGDNAYNQVVGAVQPLTIHQVASITSPQSANFISGKANSFTVKTSGFPTAVIGSTGLLPTNVTFHDNGDGTATLSGSPFLGSGSYVIDITAGNGFDSPATQVFTLNVQYPPTITSASSATFKVGTAGNFTPTATAGFPTATTITEAGTLPSGVTFTSGKLSGTPAAGTGGSYPITFAAANSQSSSTQSFTLKVSQAPVITSAATASFIENQGGTTFTITTTGFPTPHISSGALPVGLSITDNNNGAATISGTATVAGTFNVTITASNEIGMNATQTLALTLAIPPTITSDSSATFKAGTAGSFTPTATAGFPTTTTFSESGKLPSGVTFTSGMLTGTAAAGTGGTYPIIFTASNGAASTSQNFPLTVDEAPAITSAAKASFIQNQTGTKFTITTTGFPFPTITSGALPAGLSLTDNHNGTATISGTATTSGSFNVTITAHNGIGANATQTLVLTLAVPPTFTSAKSATFKVGTAGSFTPAASGGFPTTITISETGKLPSGVTFTSGKLSGTPAAGTGGSYPITFTASNGSASSTQSFTLKVDQAPAITSAAKATFIKSQAGTTFTITTTGFPAPAITSGTLPGGLSLIDNHNGTATIKGTATTSGNFNVTITAKNGIGTNATQTLILTLALAPTITSANNATFKVGTAGSFTPAATAGFPSTTTISESGKLRSGVTLTSGKLSGTPAADSGGSYPITFTASPGAPGATSSQAFTLTVQQALAITSATSATFVEGQAGTFTVTATGFPVAALKETGALPAGVTFVDNHNGTATLSGTAQTATGGNYTLTIAATDGGVEPKVTQTFTLTIVAPPAFTSANTVSFTANTAGSFTVTTTGFPVAAISESGTLPTGLTLVDNKNGTATLSGTPTEKGTFAITLSAVDGSLTASEMLTITVA